MAEDATPLQSRPFEAQAEAFAFERGIVAVARYGEVYCVLCAASRGWEGRDEDGWAAQHRDTDAREYEGSCDQCGQALP